MSNEMNPVKQAIKSYLDKRAAEDELFAKSYAKSNKSLDECFNYVVGEAKKRGNAVYMSDEEVFGLAVHYYDEDDIKVNKLPAGTMVQATASVELTEEEKEKAREQAIEDYKKQCVQKLEAAEKVKAQKAAEKRKADIEKRKKAEQLIPNLFEFDEV